jgi:hypothetical protein
VLPQATNHCEQAYSEQKGKETVQQEEGPVLIRQNFGKSVRGDGAKGVAVAQVDEKKIVHLGKGERAQIPPLPVGSGA